MKDIYEVLPSVALLIEIIGLFLLAREVWRGKEIDELTRGFGESSLLLFLYAAKNYQGFAIASRLYVGDTPEQARRWVPPESAAALEAAIEDEWKTLGEKLVISRTRLEERTLPAVRWRGKRDLIVGTGLLMTATAIHWFLNS